MLSRRVTKFFTQILPLPIHNFYVIFSAKTLNRTTYYPGQKIVACESHDAHGTDKPDNRDDPDAPAVPEGEPCHSEPDSVHFVILEREAGNWPWTYEGQRMCSDLHPFAGWDAHKCCCCLPDICSYLTCAMADPQPPVLLITGCGCPRDTLPPPGGDGAAPIGSTYLGLYDESGNCLALGVPSLCCQDTWHGFRWSGIVLPGVCPGWAGYDPDENHLWIIYLGCCTYRVTGEQWWKLAVSADLGWLGVDDNHHNKIVQAATNVPIETITLEYGTPEYPSVLTGTIGITLFHGDGTFCAASFVFGSVMGGAIQGPVAVFSGDLTIV